MGRNYGHRPLSPAELRAMDRHTRVAHGRLWIVIDQQSFEIALDGDCAADRLSWHRAMIAIALARLVSGGAPR